MEECVNLGILWAWTSPVLFDENCNCKKCKKVVTFKAKTRLIKENLVQLILNYENSFVRNYNLEMLLHILTKITLIHDQRANYHKICRIQNDTI